VSLPPSVAVVLQARCQRQAWLLLTPFGTGLAEVPLSPAAAAGGSAVVVPVRWLLIPDVLMLSCPADQYW
jgi:hypothetical protein